MVRDEQLYEAIVMDGAADADSATESHSKVFANLRAAKSYARRAITKIGGYHTSYVFMTRPSKRRHTLIEEFNSAARKAFFATLYKTLATKAGTML